MPDTSVSDSPYEATPVDLVGGLFLSVFRRWKLVLLVAVALVVTVYVALQIEDDVYHVEAKLLLKVGRENLEVPATVARGSLVSTGVRKEDINSDVALLKSQHLLEKTIDQIGVPKFFLKDPPPKTTLQKIKRAISNAAHGLSRELKSFLVMIGIAREYSDREKAIMSIADNLVIGRDGESDVLKIQLNYPNPGLAHEVMTKLIDNFLTERLSSRRSAGFEAFFEDQMAQHYRMLDALDNELRTLLHDQKITSVQEERGLLLARRDAVTSEIAQLNTILTAVTPLSSMANDAANAADAVAAGGARYSIVFDRISEIMVKRAILLEQFAADSSGVLELEAQIGNLVLLLKASAKDNMQNLTSELSSIDKRLSALSKAEIRIGNLNRQRERLQKLLDTDSDKLEEARVDSQLDLQRVANIAILSAPSESIKPAGPRRLVITMVSIPIGLILGVIFASLLGYFDKRIYRAEDIISLRQVNFLGQVSRRPRNLPGTN